MENSKNISDILKVVSDIIENNIINQCSVLVAVADIDNDFVGYEINSEYQEIANKRIVEKYKN